MLYHSFLRNNFSHYSTIHAALCLQSSVISRVRSVSSSVSGTPLILMLTRHDTVLLIKANQNNYTHVWTDCNISMEVAESTQQIDFVFHIQTWDEGA